MGITVIIPLYNKAANVEKCLQSITKQNYTNFEVIIINDGSTDGSERVVEKFLIDNRFNIIHEKNSGVSHARNIGIKMAKNEHIVFIDADDYIEPNYFSELLNNVEQNNKEMIIISGFKKGKKSYTSPQQKLTKKELINSYSDLSLFLNLPSGKLYSTSIIHKNKIFFDESINYGEDLEFNLRYFNQDIIFKVINYAGYWMVETEHGLSRSSVPLMLEYQSKIINTAQKMFGSNNDTQAGAEQIIIKAAKTVLNYDIKAVSSRRVFYEHIEKLSQLLIKIDYFYIKLNNYRGIQDKILWILIKKNMCWLLLIIFKLKNNVLKVGFFSSLSNGTDRLNN